MRKGWPRGAEASALSWLSGRERRRKTGSPHSDYKTFFYVAYSLARNAPKDPIHDHATLLPAPPGCLAVCRSPGRAGVREHATCLEPAASRDSLELRDRRCVQQRETGTHQPWLTKLREQAGVAIREVELISSGRRSEQGLGSRGMLLLVGEILSVPDNCAHLSRAFAEEEANGHSAQRFVEQPGHVEEVDDSEERKDVRAA
eukprot:7243092-Prymnesium_polylepis.2